MAVKQLIFDLQFKVNKSQRDLNKLEKELKEVEKQLQETEEGTIEYAEAQKKLAEINRQLTGTMQDQGKAASSLDDKFKKAARSVTTFLGIAGGVQVLRNGVTIFGNYEQALADLSAITGATGGDLEFFKEQARELGRTTTVSATDALKAFELIGSARPELLKNKEALAEVTAEAITLSEAAGLEVPEAARALAGSLNQFNLASSESNRVINALAAGSKEGAAAIPALADGLEKFGAVANANNVTLEQSIALQETLAEKNIQGAEAGTQLRNIILRLNKEGLGFVDGQFDIVAALEQARAGLESIQDPAERSAELQRLFGLESATAAQILLDNTEGIEAYTKAVTDTDVAVEQARIRTETIQGSLQKLNNRWQDFIIGQGEAAGGSERLRKAIDFLSDNLETILNLVIRIARDYLVYVGAIKAARIATQAYQTVTKGLALVQTLLQNGIKGTITQFRNFNKVARANIIGGLAVLVVELADAFGFLSGKTDEQVDAQERLNDAIDEAVAKAEVEINSVQRSIAIANDKTLSDEQRKKALDELVATYPDYLEGLTLETLGTKEATEAVKNLTEALQLKARINAITTIQEEDLARAARLRQALDRNDTDTLVKLIAGEEKLQEVREASEGGEVARFIANKTRQQARIAAAAEIFQLESGQKDLNQQIIDLQIELGNIGKDSGDAIADGQGNAADATARTVEVIKEEIKAQRDLLEQVSSKAAAEPIQQRIKDLQAELAAILGVNNARGAGSKKTRENAEKELTFLDRLEAQLKRNLMEREKLVNLQTPENDPYLKSLKAEAVEIEANIKRVKDLIAVKQQDNKEDELGLKIAENRLAQIRALSTEGFDIIDGDLFDSFQPLLNNLDIEEFELAGSEDPEDIARIAEIQEQRARIEARIAAFRKDGIDEAKINRDFELTSNELRIQQIDEEIEKIRERGDLTDEQRIKIINLQTEQEKLNEKNRELNRIAFEEEGLKLIEEERIALQERILDGELETNEQIVEAERETQLRILDIRIAAMRDRLSMLDEESLAYKKLYGDILELENQRQDLEQKGAEERQKFSELDAEEQIDLIKMVGDAALDTSDQIIQQKIEEVDRLIALQEERVQAATTIADRGNAEILEQERERLANLQEERKKFVQAQQALAAAEFLANTTAAIAKTAAESGVLSPIFIATTLAAIIGGIAQARALAAGGSFFEGGYTGDGSPYQESTALGNRGYTYHRGEFVMDAATTATGNNRQIFESVLSGRRDLGAELAQRYTMIDVSGGMSDAKADEIIGAINSIPETKFKLDKRGIFTVTRKFQGKQARINKLTRR